MTKTVETITCRVCQTEKEQEQFRVQSYRKLGRDTTCNECRALHRRENGEYLAETVRYHAKRVGQRVAYVKVDDYLDIIAAYKDCAYCGVELSDNRTFDHVYPISSSDYGGKHVKENIVACCRQCNSSKHTSNLYDFYQRKESFTPELWRKFLKTFISRMIDREITDAEVDEMTFHMKAESEEISEWHANQAKPLDKAN